MRPHVRAWILFLPVIALLAAGSIDHLAAQVASVTPSSQYPAHGSTIAACVHITPGGMALLGSYGAKLEWNPSVLAYQSYSGGNPPFDTPVVNTADVAIGRISFSDASPLGAAGSLFVFCVELMVSRPAAGPFSSPLDLTLTSLYTPGFTNLLPTAIVTDSSVNVLVECTIADVLADPISSINSGDALVLLANEIALPIPAASSERILARCGDVNGDGSSNSIDSNIDLSFEVGISIAGTFLGMSNRTSENCGACSGGAGGGVSAPVVESVEGASISGEVTAAAEVSGGMPRRGEEFEVTVAVDLGTSGYSLGSYGALLAWDSRAVEFVGALGGSTRGFPAALLNGAEASKGLLRFAQADPLGATGRVEILRARFRARRTIPHPQDIFFLSFTSMGTPAPGFTDLLPVLVTEHGR